MALVVGAAGSSRFYESLSFDFDRNGTELLGLV